MRLQYPCIVAFQNLSSIPFLVTVFYIVVQTHEGLCKFPIECTFNNIMVVADGCHGSVSVNWSA